VREYARQDKKGKEDAKSAPKLERIKTKAKIAPNVEIPRKAGKTGRAFDQGPQ